MARSLSKSLSKSAESLDTEQTHDWQGASGKSYRYYIISISNTFRDTPGNYIYTKLTPNKTWEPLYIGQTSSLSRRPEGNYSWEHSAVSHGATHIHAHTSDADENIREEEKFDLIRLLHPPLNEMVTK